MLERKKKFERKEEKGVAEVREQFGKEVAKNLRLRKLFEHTQRFIDGWLRHTNVHKGDPEAKSWFAYIANDPTGAACYGATVDPAVHLPYVVNGCLTTCRLCD